MARPSANMHTMEIASKCAADPLAQEKMSRAGDEPAGDQGKKDESALSALGHNNVLVFSFCHSFLTISQQAGVGVSEDGINYGLEWRCFFRVFHSFDRAIR